MAVAGGSILMGRVVAVTVSRSAAVMGVEAMESPNLPLCAFGPPRARLSMISFSSRTFVHRGLHTRPGVARFDPSTTGAAMIANSVPFKRSAQLERHLNPRPWNERRLLSTNATAAAGSPSPTSFIVQLIEKIIQVVASLLPGRAVVEKVEAEVDAAAAMVEQGAKIVSEIANKVENLANAAELGAEEVEKIAQKVDQVTKNIQQLVDEVADVLEGEKGAANLKRAVEQLKNIAATRRAEETAVVEVPPKETLDVSLEEK